MSTLTEANRREDASVPVPPLTPVEAENLFLFLAEKKLVFFHVETDAYVLNKVEAHLWRSLIKDLKKPDWIRSSWYSNVSTGFWFIIGGLIGGFIGGYSGALGKKAAELPAHKSEPNPDGSVSP